MATSSYDRLREKYDKEVEENSRLKNKLNQIQNGIAKPEGIPDFIFNAQATNLDIYNFLKDRPDASEFVFNKYSNNREFIKELCIQKNPIYLPNVEKNLKEIIELDKEKESLASLVRQKNEIRDQIPLLESEKESAEKEVNGLRDEVGALVRERDELSKYVSNLRQDIGYTEVSGFIEKVHSTIKDIMDVWKPAPGFETLTLQRSDALRVRELIKESERLSNLLINSDFLTSEILDKKHQELDEEMKKVDREVQLFRDRNPWGVLDRMRKSADKIKEKSARDHRNDLRFWDISDNFVDLDVELSKLEVMKR